jgi:hypothetical protein
VVHRRERELGPAHRPACEPQAFERLRRGDLVDQVQVDVQERRLVRLLADDVRLPDMLEQGPRRRQLFTSRSQRAQYVAGTPFRSAPAIGTGCRQSQ